METFRGPYKPGPIEPIVDPGQQVLLAWNGGYNLYLVSFIEQLPRSHTLVANLGAPAAGANLAQFNTNNILDMDYGTFGQFRCQVLDDIHAILSQPAATNRWADRNIVARLNAYQALEDPCGHTSEFYIFEDQRIFLTGTNPTGYALVQARVAFWGFKYVLEGADGRVANGGHLPPLRKPFTSIAEATASGEKFKVVPVGGW